MMHKALHCRDDKDRLFVSRKRGLANIEDSVDRSIRRLEDYIKKNEERLITATRTTKTPENMKKSNCMDVWKGKLRKSQMRRHGE